MLELDVGLPFIAVLLLVDLCAPNNFGLVSERVSTATIVSFSF